MRDGVGSLFASILWSSGGAKETFCAACAKHLPFPKNEYACSYLVSRFHP